MLKVGSLEVVWLIISLEIFVASLSTSTTNIIHHQNRMPSFTFLWKMKNKAIASGWHHNNFLLQYRSTRRTQEVQLNRFLFDPSEIDKLSTQRSNCSSDTENNVRMEQSIADSRKIDVAGKYDNHWKNNDSMFSAQCNGIVPTVTLPPHDYRSIHAANILNLQSGDTIRAGVVGRISVQDSWQQQQREGVPSLMTTAQEIQALPYTTTTGLTTDKAVATWVFDHQGQRSLQSRSLQIQLHSLALPSSPTKGAVDGSSRVSLLLALPRPLQLGRMLPMIAQMGVNQLILTSAKKVPLEYFGSHLLCQTKNSSELNHAEVQRLLVEGLCQAGDVRLPQVLVRRNLKRFLEEELDTMFPRNLVARVIAHPLRLDDAKGVSIRMKEVVFPIDLESSGNVKRRILLTVGPEGGWEEDYELNLFKKHGFQQVTLGTRILRSDVAVISLLGLAHEVVC